MPSATQNWRSRLPFFFGWWVVAATFVVMALLYGAAYYSFSVFFVALLQEFGWSRAALAGAFSLFLVGHGFGGAAAGVLTDRFGPGRVSAAGAAILAAGLLASSRITDLWQFYLFYGAVSAVGLALAGWVPCVTMINRWFSARIGVALGVTSAGTGMGIFTMVPISQMLIGGLGWRMAYGVLAAVVLVGVVPTALLLMRGRPEEFGLARDGRRFPSETRAGLRDVARAYQSRVVDQKWAGRSWTVSMALRTGRYWSLCAMLVLVGIAVQMVFVHQVAFLVDGGYDPMLAASLVGAIGFLSMGGKVGWGWVSDRLGREIAYTLGTSFLLLGILLLSLTRLTVSPGLVYLYSAMFALGYAVSPPMGPMVAADIFAGRHYGAIYGSLGIASGLGSAGGAWLGGYVFDLTGSYFLALACAAVSGLVSAGAIWVCAPRKVRRAPGLRRGTMGL